jgi:hypothetical protein
MPDRRAVAGAVRWWTPLLWIAVGTVGLIFAAWAGGVDMKAAAERMADRLDQTFHRSTKEYEDKERGRLVLELDRRDQVRRVLHNGRELPPEELVIDDGYFTITSLRYDDGELMYWRLPMDREDEHREEVRNPRWRMLMHVHPRAPDEPPGLRVARVGDDAAGPRAAAARAGVRVGDVIVGYDDERPATSAELEAGLQLAIAECAPGGVIALLVERGGAEQVLRVELEPLLSRAEWEAVPGDDPVERWLAHCMPWRRDRDRESREVSATETPGAAGRESDRR